MRKQQARNPPHRAARQRAFVAPFSFGLGDLVLSLPAVQGLIDARWETWLVARSLVQERLAERIEGLSGVVREEHFDPSVADGRWFNLRDHPLQTDHFWGSAEFEHAYGKQKINQVLATICDDLGIPAEFSKPAPLRASRRAKAHDSVLFVVDTDGPSKRWPTERWLRLAERVRRLGLELRVLSGGGGPVEAELRAAGVAAAEAPALGDAVDWLSSCRGVVGIDTGLTHIAVQQGTPTVAIHRADPFFFRPWPHCRLISGERCDPECLRRAMAVAHHRRVERPAEAWSPWECAVDGRCLATISEDSVLASLQELLPT
jgi:Glycosyltransferase family 9 (heptosyltransferase)